jgi:TolA-binding protein
MQHRTEKYYRNFRIALNALGLMWILSWATQVPGAPAASKQDEQMVQGEEALWAMAGQTFARSTDRSAARQQYRLFLQTYGKSQRAAEAQYMLGECCFADGDHAAAYSEFEKVAGLNGADEYLKSSVLLRKGECLYNLGRFGEALAEYQRLITEFADTFLLAEALFELGQNHLAQENWRELEVVYRMLLEQQPGYGDLPQVQFSLGLFDYREQRYDEAMAHFSEVPLDRGLYYLGRCLEDTGQYIRAIQQYRLVLRRYPDSPLADDVAFSIAEAFYSSGQNSVAERSFREFLEQYPDSRYAPSARYKLACVAFREGRFDESVRMLKEIADLFPDITLSGFAQYLIGDCYLEMGRKSEAIFAWTEVVRRYGQTTVASSALHKVVYTYCDERNFDQAVIMADEFLGRFPGDPLAPRVRMLQGFSHYQLTEYEQAIRSFHAVLDKYVNTEVAERALCLATMSYYRQGELDRLVTNYNFLAGKLLPTSSQWRARTYYYLGEAYYARGLFRQAEGMYRLVLTGYPRSNVAAPALQGLVASLSHAGDYELALLEQEKFLLALANADSEKGANSLAVGSIHFNQHRYQEALDQFSAFLKKYPDDPQAALALDRQADCYYRLQYYDQAIAGWQKILERFPGSPEAQVALYRVADTQFGLGQFDSAAASYGRLLEDRPEGARAADARFGLANCAYNLGKDDQAIEVFEAFLLRHPDDPRSEDAELGIQSCYYRSGRDMEEYLARNPDSPLAADIYWNKGQQAFADGDFAAAGGFFEKVTLDYPDSESGPGSLFYLSESYYQLENLDQALAGFRNFIVTHPEHDLTELAHLRAATVLFKQEKYLAAAQGYERQTDLFPAGQYAPLAAFNAAVCYQEVEDWHAAIGGYTRFLADYPDHENSAGLWVQIAHLYKEEVGDFQQAAQAFANGLDQGQLGLAEARYRQGECMEQDRRLDRALEFYRQGAEGGPAADPFRIASLGRMAELAEDRGDWPAARAAWQEISVSGGQPEWTEMARDRLIRIENPGG